MKYTDLPNKHDKDLNWDKQIIKEKRIKYLESELGSKDRLDGWTVDGLQKELDKLKNN
tara:strand:- start:393 stop:566 length:174 start_codon:yes stop_codon:yes gene_type:complete